MADEQRLGIRSGIQGRVAAASPSEVTEPRRVALHQLAAETRRLIELLVETGASIGDLEATTAEVRAAADRFEGKGLRAPVGFAEVANAGAELDGIFDNSPLIGKANPLSPPLLLEVEDDAIVGEVTFGAAYEGPPGCVHGGYVAAMFDELLGAAQSLSGSAGMTGTLTVRYIKPTPLHTLLRVRAWVERVERRKIMVTGVCEVDGQQVSEAHGIFISLEPERFVRLREDRDALLSARSTDQLE